MVNGSNIGNDTIYKWYEWFLYIFITSLHPSII